MLLMAEDGSKPKPTLQWRMDGGAWHSLALTWNPGIVNGNASCASPCWKTGMISFDVPAHATYTIDFAVIFNPGSESFFSSGVYYTANAMVPDGVAGPEDAFSYMDPNAPLNGSSGSSSSSHGSSGSSSSHGSSSGSSSGSSGSKSSSSGSRTAVPSQSAVASPHPSVSATPSPAADTATVSVSSPPASLAASPSLAPVADAKAGGSGMSGDVLWIAIMVVVLAAGAGYVLTRRRRGNPPRSGA
ncbi:hypothetical protein [Actinospica robiniae]|uniref:hypothetical protein n=1 Tax=Actinospica robiniae TaxID=304901 RepID=UPI0004227025|nr:hypothetical protein [Actinospica robiniae]